MEVHLEIDARVLTNVAIHSLRESEYLAAYHFAQRALQLDASCASAFVVLAFCLVALAKYDEAEDYIQRALSSATDRTVLLRAKEAQARVWYHRKDPQAKDAIEQLLATPDFLPVNTFALLFALMKLNAYGLPESILSRPWLLPPYCDGPLAGKTIFVTEAGWMGLGDVIQCLRYVSALKDTGARVFVGVREHLLPLMPASRLVASRNCATRPQNAGAV